MIKIGEKVYNNEIVEIFWEKFLTSDNKNGVKKKIEGVSPYINIKVEDTENIVLGIETNITNAQLNKLAIKEKIDLREYITDIIFIKDNIVQPVWHEEDQFLVTLVKVEDNIANFNLDYASLNIVLDIDIKW